MTLRQAAIGVLFVLVVIGGLAIAGVGKPKSQGHFCAGVGIVTETTGATPRDAFTNFITSLGEHPRGWRQHGDSGFDAIDEHTRPQGWTSLSTEEITPGVWRVSGACVGNLPTTGTTIAGALLCRTLDLRLEVNDFGQGATGHATTGFTVTNTSQKPCELNGTPTVQLFGASGSAMPFAYAEEGASMVRMTSPGPVRVEPGAHAYFFIEKYRCDERVIAETASVRLLLDGPGTLETAVQGIPFCGDGNPGSVLHVSPFVATPEAAYQ